MRFILAFALVLCTSCAHRAPQVVPVPEVAPAQAEEPQDEGKVTATPSRRTDIIQLPAWLNASVEVCLENFPRSEQECISVGELREYAFARKHAH